MHVRSITLVLIAALAFAATALATGATKDPMSLGLQRADFPDGTSFTASRERSQDLAILGGFKGRAVDYQAEIPFTPSIDCFQSMTQCWFLEGKLFVGTSRGQARKLYALASARTGCSRTSPSTGTSSGSRCRPSGAHSLRSSRRRGS
jgi:hypothetical protein